MEKYTMKKWSDDGMLRVAVGQVCDAEVMERLINGVPPRTYRYGMFQMGEPYDYDFNAGRALYETFESVGDGEYKYIGLKYGID